ncbi:MAG: AgmX/PglI C-terminal domain-containing protein [Gammaproteobacteria bacterium]|nr:AgmX/PglI C-terminal domain-containing protein [Gammaproteobacteria bacterium]MBU2479034.1 AgmX/PglI C-terminal domain-containing protein [Gammaproteobacteria bacterium]
MSAALHTLTLPWMVAPDEERRFRRILLNVCGLVLCLSVVMPYLPLPVIEEPVEELPPRLAKLILERPQPKPVVVPKPKPEPVVAVKPEPKPVPKVEPKPKVTPKVEQPIKPKPKPETQVAQVAPKPDPDAARKKAAKSGLLAFSDDLADLRDNSKLNTLRKDARVADAGKTAARTERSLLTSKVAAASGGIDTSRLSRDTGDVGLAQRGTTKVASPVAGAADTGGVTNSNGKARHASRSIEEIQMVFDRNKNAIYAMYNRALRSNPTLQGKLVLKLTISPDGQVVDCSVVSSELADAALGTKVVSRVKMFNFGTKDVEVVTITYPIDFLPA